MTAEDAIFIRDLMFVRKCTENEAKLIIFNERVAFPVNATHSMDNKEECKVESELPVAKSYTEVGFIYNIIFTKQQVLMLRCCTH